MLVFYVKGIGSRAGAEVIIPESVVTIDSLYSWAQDVLSVPKEDIYFVHNGKRLTDNIPISDGVIRAVPRLPGGKGGFGSMLRAIGAQIEKTTNREACRDLSGRRLRDINEEKRLKNWISKKADREREALERKQKKLEKLRSEPKIEFKDKKYDEERSKLPEVVHDAVEKGFQASTSKPSSSSTSQKPSRRRGFMLEEEEFSDGTTTDSSDDQSEDCNEKGKAPKRKVQSDSDSEGPSPAKKQNVNEAKDRSSSDQSDDSSKEETKSE